MTSIGRQTALDFRKLGKHIRPYLEVYNTDGCSGGIKKYEEQLQMVGITTADRVSKCTHVIWSNGRAKTLQQIKKANAEDPTKVVVVRPKWIDHLLQMDQGTVDILSKDPRKMAQLNAEFIVSHDELTRARKKHSMETIGQEVDELADPDMADFSSSQLVRDGEPFHKAKKGRTGGGRNSNSAAANTIEAGTEITHGKDEEDETEEGRNKMVEQSEDEAQCDLDAIMTSPKVILSQRPYAEVLASTAGSMNDSLPVGSSPTHTSLAPRGDVGQETMTGSGPGNVRRPYGQSLLVALAADSQEVRESEDKEGAAGIPTLSSMLNEGPDSVGSTMGRVEHSIGVGSSNQEENDWEEEMTGIDVLDNGDQENHVASANRQKVTAKGGLKGLHRKENAAGGLQVEDDNNDPQGNLREDPTKSGKSKGTRRGCSVGSGDKRLGLSPKQAVAIRNPWQCRCCTTLNRARSTKCEMCENPRGAAPEEEDPQEQGRAPGGDNQGTNDTKEGRGKAQQGKKRRSGNAEGEGDTATLAGAHKRQKSSGKQAKEAEPVTKAEPSRDAKKKRETQHQEARDTGKKQEPTGTNERKSGAGANNAEDSARKPTEVLVVSAIEEEEKQQLLDKIKALNKLQPSRPIRLKSTQDAAATCSHLIVKEARCRRTLKMLFALARGTPIIKDEWIHQSFANQEWMDESSYLVERFEDRVGRNNLLEGERIYVGPTLNPEPKLLRQLIHAAGGETVMVVKSATLVLADEEAGKQWVTTELTKRHENAILRKLVDNGCVLSKTWLFDTLEHGTKKDHQVYAIKPIRA